MKHLKKSFIALAVVVFIGGTFTASTLILSQEKQQKSPEEQPNYLVISAYQPAAGTSVNDASAEISEWVRIFRGTGKYKSVRLFRHHWGPELAFYIVSEPTDWASIPAGFNALLEAQPEFLDRPLMWQGHSDNIL